MSWAIETGSVGDFQWAQWVDVSAFNSWQLRLRDLYSLAFIDNNLAPVRAGLGGLDALAVSTLRARGVDPTWPEIGALVSGYVGGQFQFLSDVWECLSMMLRALNQPAYCCPSYTAAWIGLMGRNRYSPVGPWPTLAEGFALTQSRRILSARRCSPTSDGAEVCELGYAVFPIPRVELDGDNSSLDATLLTTVECPAPSQGLDARFPAGTDGSWLGWVDRGVPRVAFGDYVGAEWWPSPGAADQTGMVNVLMSGFDSLQMAHSVVIGGQLLRRSWREIVSRSRIYAVAHNLDQAARHGGHAPEDIIAINADIEIGRYENSTDEELARGALRAVAAIVTAANPIVGAVWTGIQEAVFALEDLVGHATGRELDPFGRTEPVFQPWWIGGNVDSERRVAPSFVVPMAPRVDVGAYPLTVAPSELPSDRVRRLLVGSLPVPMLGGGGRSSGPEELDPGSVAAAAARAWGVDARRGM